MESLCLTSGLFMLSKLRKSKKLLVKNESNRCLYKMFGYMYMRYGVNSRLDIFTFHAKEDNFSPLIEPSDFDVEPDRNSRKDRIIC